MKINGTFELVQLDNEFMAVPVGDTAENMKGVVRLNASGAEIFELLQAGLSQEEILTRLAEKYDNPPEQLAAYLTELADRLSQNGIL